MYLLNAEHLLPECINFRVFMYELIFVVLSSEVTQNQSNSSHVLNAVIAISGVSIINK